MDKDLVDNTCYSCDSDCSENSYEAYEEYYASYPEGVLTLYNDDFVKNIPGFKLFSDDSETTDFSKLKVNWISMIRSDEKKYHQYIKKFADKYPIEFRKYVHRNGICMCYLYRDVDPKSHWKFLN
jgi:hypothetical protein